MVLIDAHVHLGEHMIGSKSEIEDGRLILAVNSADAKESIEVLNLKKRLGKGVFAFIGLHPNSEQNDIHEVIKIMEADRELIDGIGEIGLDYKSDRREVKENFLKQLEIAERFGKPANIHSRGKLREVLDLIDSYRLKGVMLHWFSGDEYTLQKACDKGYMIGFGPASVYSKKLQKLIIDCPLQNILTESDAPVSYSACFEEVDSDPRLIASVTFSIAMVKKMSVEEVEKIVEENFKRYIGL